MACTAQWHIHAIFVALDLDRRQQSVGHIQGLSVHALLCLVAAD